MAKIALLGCGVVGSGVREILSQERERIAAAAGEPLEIAKILVRRERKNEPAGLFTLDFADIAAEPDITIVAECMGGLEPAYSYARQTLSAGRSFVTSNKELVAERGAQLMALAREHNAAFLFEGSVGGTVPVIGTLCGCMAANRIDSLCGILNGTTNYILTKMLREGSAFDEALAEAQRLGYAEADPAADVEGVDACRKLCILASLIFGRQISPAQVHTEGISGITARDVSAAAMFGGAVKLIACARRLPDGRAALRVTPAYLPGELPLASVDDVLNGVVARGCFTGDITLCGRGAGAEPTGSAVVSDIITAAAQGRNPPALWWGEAQSGMAADFAECPVSALVHYFGGADAARRVFGDVLAAERDGVTAALTQEMTEAALAARLAELAGTVSDMGWIRAMPR